MNLAVFNKNVINFSYMRLAFLGTTRRNIMILISEPWTTFLNSGVWGTIGTILSSGPEQGLTKLKLMVVETYRSDFLKLWFSFHDDETSLGQGSVQDRVVKFQNEVGARLIHYLF